jgi:hypothetical protein
MAGLSGLVSLITESEHMPLDIRSQPKSIVLTLVKLTQHPTYDPILFVKTLCVVPLLIY